MSHVVDGDMQRVVVTEDDHRNRVAHEDDVDLGGVDGPGRRRVVRSDHHQWRTATLSGDDIRRAQCTPF